ncbi:MAG: polysaccharide export protein, partial [Bdellovibrionales bacterium]|nr:polysaccharide export protein [Bdellovibrionales bacterium]
IEQEKALFFTDEDANRKRLLALIRSRTGRSFQAPHYRIGPGDEIEINVFDVSELNQTVSVRQSGFLTLPLIGAVRASGMSELELQNEIEERLKKYVRNPEVSLSMTKYASQKVGVMGAVKEPGSYPLKKGQNTLTELLSQAGGISQDAGSTIQFIPVELSGLAGANEAEIRAQLTLNESHRNGSQGSNSINIALDDILGTSGAMPLEIPVRGGDMVLIPAAGKVLVEGEVEQRGAYTLSQRMSLLGALAAAGGITYSAKIDEVEVMRQNDTGEPRRLVVNLEDILSGMQRDVRLRNGDLVRVPSDSSRRLRQDTFESISSIINFGVGGTIPLGGR